MLEKDSGRELAIVGSGMTRSYRWMKDEHGLIDKLRKGGRPGIRQAVILRENSQRMGMQVDLKQAVARLECLHGVGHLSLEAVQFGCCKSYSQESTVKENLFSQQP